MVHAAQDIVRKEYEMLPIAAYDAGSGIKIEAAKQLDGSTLWVVRYEGNCLNKEGQWEYEPLPSSRDTEFLARTRYDTPFAAAVGLKNAMPDLPL